MSKLKKYAGYGLQIIVFIGILVLTGCNAQDKQNMTEEGKEKKIICSTYPQYDWVKNIIGEDNKQFSVSLLLEDGGDLHNFQPTAADMVRISDCDLFITVGGESDAWVDDATKDSMNQNQKTLKLMELMKEKLKEEEHVEGMEEEHEHEKEEHANGKDEAHEHEEETEYDEHVWLSLSNAQIMVEEIAEVIATMDTDHAKQYLDNAKSYCEQLADLEQRYQEAVDKADKKVLVFGDRFPFRYLVEDYGITYYAAFPGCSAETEASFETVAFLSEKIKEYQLSSVLVLENSDQKVADAIIANTDTKDQKVLVMNSLQSVKKEEIENGITYMGTMEKNLEVLKQALQ